MTAQTLREWFTTFNAQYFGNTLPEPHFVVNHAKRTLGQFSCHKVRRGLLPGRWKTTGYTIKVSEFYHTSDHDRQSVLLHEMIHFYIAYLHPYFDGNDRMARLIHLWYLVQQGYTSALFIPLSEYIEKSRTGYYGAYTLAEQNAKISGVMDITPFLVYFIENVYHKLANSIPPEKTTDAFLAALDANLITEKEKDLWYFVLSAYGDAEFSTKQLEKDFGHAAYATIRSFVLKFEKLGLLSSQKYGNRVKYRV